MENLERLQRVPDSIRRVLRNCEGYADWRVYIDRTDNKLVYDGDIALDYMDLEEFPESFLHFKEIRGFFSLVGCKNLKSLENLRNLRLINGYLCIMGSPLKSLKGFENLERINGQIFIRNCENLKDFQFDGLNPYVKIEPFRGFPSEIGDRNDRLAEWQTNAILKHIASAV